MLLVSFENVQVFLYERTLNASKELIELPGLNQVLSTTREVKIKKRSSSLPLLKLPCSPHLLISDSFIGAQKFSLFVAEVLSPLFVSSCVSVESSCSLFISLVHLQPLYWLPFIFPLLINLWIFRDKPSHSALLPLNLPLGGYLVIITW